MPPAPPDQQPVKFSRGGILVLWATAIVSAAGGIVHAYAGGTWSGFDATGLAYLAMPALLVLIGAAKSFKIGTEGVEWERLETRVAAVAALARDTDARVDATQLVLTNDVGRKPVLAYPEHRNVVESDDPLAAKYKGHERDNGREISADVSSIPGMPEWFLVRVRVRSTDDKRPLQGIVQFHLHPTFRDPDPVVPVVDGVAALERVAWGAFTLGADADDGATHLGIDLSALPNAPEVFRSR